MESVIGVTVYGTGYGTDGTIWKCEIMAANLPGFERLARLVNVPLRGKSRRGNDKGEVHVPWYTRPDRRDRG